MVSPFPLNLRLTPKQSAQPFFTVYHNILLKCRSTSSSLSYNKWLGRPHDRSLSPVVGSSMQSWMETKSASTALKSLGLKSNMLSPPSARTFNTSATYRPSLTINSSPSLSSIPPILSATQAMPQQRIRIDAHRSFPCPRRRASVSSFLALKVRPASGQCLVSNPKM